MLVMPALVLNYLGQGALVLADPAAAADPFFLLFPDWLLIPAVVLTTAATVIASQAVISGAFALVQQAIQLGALPRLEVRQTSEESAGQVYVPQINWLLVAGGARPLCSVFAVRMLWPTLTGSRSPATCWSPRCWSPPLRAESGDGRCRCVLPVAGLFLVARPDLCIGQLHKIPDGRLVSAARRRRSADADAVLAPRTRCRAFADAEDAMRMSSRRSSPGLTRRTHRYGCRERPST